MVFISSYRGIPPKPMFSGCYRAPTCNLFTPNWKTDPWRTEFCTRFGHLDCAVTSAICPQIEDPCEDIHQPLNSLDYFSMPPMYRHGMCQTQFRCHKAACEPNLCHELLGCGEFCRVPGRGHRCPGIPQLPPGYKPNPRPHDDTICGLCINTAEYERRKADAAAKAKACEEEEAGVGERDGRCDLPFEVYLADTRTEEEKRLAASGLHGIKRSGVDYCLHPSAFRSLDTVHKTEYLDYFKLKPRCELNLYRTALAIDNSRPRITLPKSTENDMREFDLSQPIEFHAKAIRMKMKGGQGRPTYSVCIPGPITIG